jgi:hypothetical protein
MIKKISGTWFEFEHHNSIEGKYYNQDLLNFTEQQWREKINDIADLQMEYIVLLATSLDNEAYFPSEVYPRSKHQTPNLIEVLLDQASKRKIKVFLSVGFYGNWRDPYRNMTDPEVTKLAFKAIRELYELYSCFDSFYGWYLPDETEVNPYFDSAFMQYVNKYAQYLRKLDATKKLLIAPYGTRKIKTDAFFVEQLKNLSVDYIAYQDEVGVRKSTTKEISKFYANLRRAHDQANGPALWADIELFTFEGKTYESPLLSGEFSRIMEQLKQVSPFVDVVLAYQYLGLMNSAEGRALAGERILSQKLYQDYAKWLKERKNEDE